MGEFPLEPLRGGGGSHFGGTRLEERCWGWVWRKGVQGSLLAPGDARLPTGSEWRMEANGTHRRVSWEQRLWRDQVWESREGSLH